ncbi:MAG: FeoB-associated Cys-rich membrane protein [Clostridia bacterium]|nr:FeoB-associated Cys-rich membrane protein [Clostridia bacterium]
MATVIVGGIVLLVVALVIRVMIRDKKSGKHSCGGNCANCKGCHH